jgi:hypothetical protein
MAPVSLDDLARNIRAIVSRLLPGAEVDVSVPQETADEELVREVLEVPPNDSIKVRVAIPVHLDLICVSLVVKDKENGNDGNG